MSNRYRDCLREGMTPCEAEEQCAEDEEFERLEREFHDREERKTLALTSAQDALTTAEDVKP